MDVLNCRAFLLYRYRSCNKYYLLSQNLPVTRILDNLMEMKSNPVSHNLLFFICPSSTHRTHLQQNHSTISLINLNHLLALPGSVTMRNLVTVSQRDGASVFVEFKVKRWGAVWQKQSPEGGASCFCLCPNNSCFVLELKPQTLRICSGPEHLWV